jgi:hypothetical protein
MAVSARLEQPRDRYEYCDNKQDAGLVTGILELCELVQTHLWVASSATRQFNSDIVIKNATHVAHLPHRTGLVSDRDLHVGKGRHLKRGGHYVEEWLFENVGTGPDAVEDERHASALVGHVQRIR